MNNEELFKEFQVKAQWAIKCVAYILELADKMVEENFENLEPDVRYDLVKFLVENTLEWLQ